MREVMLALHFIGLAMGLGTSFAFMFLGMISSKMEKEAAEKFMVNALGLARMGHIGLLLLLISGGYLMTPYWSLLPSKPFLIAKLILFLVLGALIGIISAKARKAANGDLSQLIKIRPLGMLSMITGLTIVGLAVYVFR